MTLSLSPSLSPSLPLAPSLARSLSRSLALALARSLALSLSREAREVKEEKEGGYRRRCQFVLYRQFALYRRRLREVHEALSY